MPEYHRRVLTSPREQISQISTTRRKWILTNQIAIEHVRNVFGALSSESGRNTLVAFFEPRVTSPRFESWFPSSTFPLLIEACTKPNLPPLRFSQSEKQSRLRRAQSSRGAVDQWRSKKIRHPKSQAPLRSTALLFYSPLLPQFAYPIQISQQLPRPNRPGLPLDIFPPRRDVHRKLPGKNPASQLRRLPSVFSDVNMRQMLPRFADRRADNRTRGG